MNIHSILQKTSHQRISSVGSVRRLADHTHEVTGSNPVHPTSVPQTYLHLGQKEKASLSRDALLN
jgi:hypothetical protein